MKVDIRYHFSIVFALSKSERIKPEGEPQFTCKCFYGRDQIELMKQELIQVE